jgi:phosphate transport system ATP-binding protein
MVKFEIKNLSVWFGAVQSLKNVVLDIQKDEILTIIGPSNSGKTTFLRCLDRMNELNPASRMEGSISFDGHDLFALNVEMVRRKIGMVFALPLPLPLTIFENISYGLKMHGIGNRSVHLEKAEKALRQASIWDEVKDRLHTSAFKLSGGQQQRLCIARTLALEPDVILFDEPCSGLDPISTAKVEEAMIELKKEYTIVLVTNNVKQAARVGDRTAFFLNGALLELDLTKKIFTTPSDQRTDDYIRGKFG